VSGPALRLSPVRAEARAALQQGETPEPLVRALEELVLTVREAENLVVLKTLRGAAPMVATAIDDARIAPVVATVAGNDTVLAITRSAVAGGIIARYFRTLAGVGPRRARPGTSSPAGAAALSGAAIGEESR
jgi:arginine repressor